MASISTNPVIPGAPLRTVPQSFVEMCMYREKDEIANAMSERHPDDGKGIEPISSRKSMCSADPVSSSE